MIPGSSLHGALRSLHETLTGSCLRIFDPDLVPVYRDAAADTRSLRLALVDKVDRNGRPVGFLLCREGDPQALRVHQSVLTRLDQPDGVLSGSRVSITRDAAGRVTGADLDPQGSWVIFISDDGARDKSEPYYAAVRELAANSDSPVLGDQAWQDYLAAVAGADDLRPAKASTAKFEVVRRGAVVLGRRYRASTELRDGQPVWLRLDAAQREVTQLQLAQIWRHRGTLARNGGRTSAGNEAITDYAGARVPTELRACTTWKKLCPSCRLFGAADTRQDGAARAKHADQQSYRGHVRVSDALTVDVVMPVAVTLPPLGVPRPGAGQFYLEPVAPGNGGFPALREWGSAADRAGVRQFRGRKYYWHTDPGPDGGLPARGVARSHHLPDSPDGDESSDGGNAMVSDAVVFPAGTRFTATLTVVDVDDEQLGSLLCVLEPALALDSDDLLVHVGGGRPLGYGSCEVSVDRARTRLWRSADRYRRPDQDTSVDEVIDATVRRFRQVAPAEVQATWPALAKVLSAAPEGVPPDRVWYPPGARWTAVGTKGFDEGYQFWIQGSGLRLGRPKAGTQRTGYPLAPLPHVTDADQSMPIVSGDAVSTPLSGEEL